jgi:hypothetical protein
MSDHDDSDDTHIGFKIVPTEDGLDIAVTAPHKSSECGAAIEVAEQAMRGHETVYEAKDAAATRTSVGYSKSYANNYDSVFGNN